MNQLNYRTPEKPDATDEYLGYSLYTYIKSKLYENPIKKRIVARSKRFIVILCQDFVPILKTVEAKPI